MSKTNFEPGAPGWKTLAREVILHQPPYVTVESRRVQLPDGTVIPNWQWVRTPDYINVLARREDGRFLVFRQAKYGLEGLTLAPVGGYLEPGEEPLEAAQRELLEETGCKAARWIDLGSYRVDPNRGVAVGHLFLALEARRVTEPDSDDLEEQHLLALTRAELEEALDAGEFQVLAWAAAVVFALRWLERAEPGKTHAQ